MEMPESAQKPGSGKEPFQLYVVADITRVVSKLRGHGALTA
jgi:hypothetical protein